LPDEL
jgi:hypothetical protein